MQRMSVTESHESPLLVTKHDVMEALQVSLRTVDRYIADGKLIPVRITSRTTRITRKSLDALVANASATAEAQTAPEAVAS